MLSKIRQREIPYDFIYVCNLKVKINEQAKQQKSHSCR